MRVLLDANVLLRLDDPDSSDHPVCAAALDRLLAGDSQLCICAQVMIEYWAVATRPIVVNGLGMAPAEASRNLYDALAAFACLPEPDNIGVGWLDLVTAHSVSGKQAHDARLAAFMIAYGITQLLTLNPSDFARYPEITPVTPADIPSGVDRK